MKTHIEVSVFFYLVISIRLLILKLLLKGNNKPYDRESKSALYCDLVAESSWPLLIFREMDGSKKMYMWRRREFKLTLLFSM